MYCKKCQSKLNGNEKFCPNCGEACDIKSENNGHKINLAKIIFIAIIVFIGFIFLSSIYKASKLKNVKLLNINFDYDSSEWRKIGLSSLDYAQLQLKNKKGNILIEEHYLEYQSLEQYVNEFKNKCTYPCKVIEDINTININDSSWFKFAISRNGYSNLYLYNTKDKKKTYVIIYSAKDLDYFTELSKAEKVYKTIKFN